MMVLFLVVPQMVAEIAMSDSRRQRK